MMNPMNKNDRIEWCGIITDLHNIDQVILDKFPSFKSNRKSHKNFKDLTGSKFGNLLVLYRGENLPNGVVTWICQCMCEKFTIIRVRAGNLSSGNTNSCGCYAVKQSKNACKKYNNYDLSGDYGVGYCSNDNTKFYFDLEDYDKIKNYCWHHSIRGYIETRDDGKLIKMHRLIMDVTNPDVKVDHKFHDKDGKPRTYDNRKENLRVCTQQNNSCNQKLRSDNTSGITGVTLDKRRNTWQARITCCGQKINLGSFKNKNDAIAARQAKEYELFREYQYKEYIEEI